MKRNFTYALSALVCVLFTTATIAQCLTGGNFTAGTTNTFDFNTENFTGDFVWSSSGSGQLESTPVSGPTTKTLTTSTLTLPNNATTIAWSYNLAGTATVQGYTVEALYYSNNAIQTVAICSGGALSTTGANLTFAAVAPSQIIGQNFQLRITYNASSTGSSSVTKTLTVDNFRTNAFASQIILPVNFSYFNASAGANGVLLTWLVNDEVNVNRYEIEHSSNGRSFNKIGSVNANGSVQYNYTDANYTTGSNYYRIKAIDNDGKFKYSSVVLFKVGKKGLALRIYPLPATNEVTLEHDIATSSSVISIMSIEGRLIRSMKPAAGQAQSTIDVSTMKPGVYVIKYTTDNQEATSIKLIKQ